MLAESSEPSPQGTDLVEKHDTKPVSTRDTKVNFSNVSSRINSGLKKPRIRTSKADGREKVVPAPSSARDELVIAGNTPVPTQPADGTAAAGHGKPVKQKLRSVSFQMPTKADEAVPMAKAIKTLTFAGDVVEETKHTAHQLHQRSHRTQYQLPAEVKARLSKSVKKPPPTSQSSNQKPPRAPQTINQKCSQTPQPAKQKPLLMTQSAHEKSGNESSQGKEQKVRQRVRSAPPSRKLSRERSADRKIRSEDNGIEAEKFEQKEEVVRPLEHESVVLSLYEAGNSNKAAHVLTAMELIGNEQANSQSNCEEEAEGGLSGVHQPSRPSTAHIFSKKPQGLTRRAQSAPSRRRASTQPSRTTIIPPHKYIEREDPDEIEQLTQVHAKMAHLGVGLDRTILDRALLPPASQSVNRCQQEMRKQLHTAGLLSSPDKWLKEEYKSLKKAKQRLDCQKQGVNIKKTNKVAA
ncbi:uncharacterized protein [Watersipora subatra]|uniref:uncharacterized protein n=1 Tax=Watersipora subatra TaxID=2589382 RepID=UPI00355BD7AF